MKKTHPIQKTPSILRNLSNLSDLKRFVRTGTLIILVLAGVAGLLYLASRPAGAGGLQLSTGANKIQVDMPGKYRAVMNTNDTDDYITIYDRSENDAVPDPVHEIVGPIINDEAAGGDIETVIAESITPTESTDTGTYTAKATASSGNFTGGDKYFVWVSAGLFENAGGDNVADVQIRYGTTVQYQGLINPVAGGRAGKHIAWFDVYDQPGSPTDIDLRFKLNSGTSVVMKHAQIYAINLSDLTTSDWEYDSDTTADSTHTTTPTSKASITLSDANGTKDWLVFAMEEVEVNSVSDSYNAHIYDGTNAYMAQSLEGEATDEQHTFAMMAPFNDTATNTVFSIRVSDASTGSNNHDLSKVFALNLSAFESNKTYYSPNNTTFSSATFVSIGDLNSGGNYAPTTTGNQMLFTNWINDTGGANFDFVDKLEVNSTITPTSWDWTASPATVGMRTRDATEEVSAVIPTRLSIPDTGQTIILYAAAPGSDSQVADEVSMTVFSERLASGAVVGYALRQDDTRTTTILENSPSRVRLRVEGCFDTAAGGSCLTDGSDDITVVEEYTFTPDGFFVHNLTDFQTSGVELDSTNNDDGYTWLGIEPDQTDDAFDDSSDIYYGDGTTESSTSADGAFEDSNTYVVLPGHGTGSYQSGMVGVTDWLSQAGGTDDWFWDEDISGEIDRLYTREQGTTPTGEKNMRWFYKIRPKADLDTEAKRESYINDIDSPDTLSYTTGSAWQELGSDDWNETEGTHTLTMSGNQAVFDIDGGTTTRHHPNFKMRGWRSDRPPPNISLEGNQQYFGKDYIAGMKPVTDADFFDSGGSYTQLAAGGDKTNVNEYLYDTTNDYTLTFDSSADYFYIGSDSPFTGVNIDLATAGSGSSPDITWQYCSANSDTATACDTWSSLSVTDQESGANDFTASGAFYFTQPTWLEATVNSGPSLYYIRGARSSGSYSTYPVENAIYTDILLVHSMSEISANSQTFSVPGADQGAQNNKGDPPIAVWRMDEGSGTIVNDDAVNAAGTVLGEHDLTINGATWINSGAINEAQVGAVSLQYDGTNDYLSRSYDPDFDFGTGSFSIAGWFKRGDDITAIEYLVSHYNTTGYKIYMKADDTLCFGIDDDATWSAQDEVCSAGDVANSTWHHFEAVKNGTTSISLYIDGIFQGSDTSLAATGSLSAATTFHVGIDSDGSSNSWEGFTDEFILYNYSRTAAQVKTDVLHDPTTTSLGGPTTDPLQDGLVGYWKLDESSGNATDSSGNGTTLTDGSSSTYAGGKFGNGVDFESSSSDYLHAADSAALSQTGSISIASWIRPESVTASTEFVIAGKWDGSNESYLLEQYGDEIRLAIDSGSTYVTTDAANLATSTWYHVTGVYDSASATAAIYINGTRENATTTGTLPSSIGDDAGRFSLGADDATTGGGNFYDGIVDEVRLYNRALSPREVRELRAWAAQPVGYWSLDDGTGTTVTDISTNGHTITLPATIDASYIESVEYLEITLTGSTNETSDSANLTKSQNTANSVPFVTSMIDLNGNAGSPDVMAQMLVDVYFESGPDRVTVERTDGDGTGGQVDVGVFVVEFDSSKVSVQQGAISFTGTSDTDSITAVDQTKAAMVFYYNTNQSVDEDSLARSSVAGWFSADDTLSWERDVSDGTIAGHFFVFEAQNNEFSVQTDTFSITSGNTSNTASLSPAVDTDRSFVIGSYRTSEDGDNINDGSVTIDLDSSTTVAAERSGTAENISDIRTFVVELSADDSVQRGTFSYASDDGQETSSISEVDTTKAIAWNPNTKQGNMLNNGIGGGDNMEAFQRVKLANSTTVQGDRTAVDATTSSGAWEVIEFGGSSTSATATWRPGKYGNALDFDGTDDYMLLDDATDFDFGTGSFTVAGWVNHLTMSGGADYIMTKANAGTNGGFKVYMASDGDIVFEIDDDSAWGPDDSATSTAASYDDGAWHHVAAVKDGTSSMAIYVDGVLQGSDTSLAATGSLSNNDPIYFGIDDDGSSGAFDGSLDDIRIYNYARTQKQIVSDMNAGHPAVGSPVGSPVATWSFDEGYGTTANDNSINSNNLTLNTASWTTSGKYGLSWDGDGAAYLFRADDSDFDFAETDDMTIAGWFIRDTVSATEYILHKQTGDAGYAVYLDSDGDVVFGIGDGAAAFPEESIGGSLGNNYDDNSWHHFTAVKTGTSSIALYVDGTKVAEDTSLAVAGDMSNATSLFVGDSEGVNDGDEFGGDIDELKVYRYALTEDEVKIEFTEGKSVVFGVLGTTSSGGADDSTARSHCPPGDSTASCAPVGEWLLDENTGTSTTVDTSGNGNDGTLISITESAWVAGKVGSALDLDGSADYVDVGTGPSTVRSATFWIYPETTTEYALNFTSTTDYIWINAGTVTATGFASPSIYVNSILNGTVSANAWHFIAVTDSTAENASNFDIGRVQDALYLQGKIDHVRLYDYAISQAQIAWNYTRGSPLAWYRFDECQGTAANNAAPAASGGDSGDDGTLFIGTSGGNTSPGTCDSGAGDEAWDNGSDGQIGASLEFDDTDDYVQADDSSTFDLTSGLSIGAWVKTDADEANNVIVSKGASYEVGINADGDIYWEGASSEDDGSARVTSGSWFHVLITNDDTTLTYYVNGVATGTDSSGIAADNSTVLRIGSDGTNFFDGQIDDVKVWNFPLTAQQVRNEYNEAAAVRFK